MDRDHAARQAQQTLAILSAGRYEGPAGEWVSIRDSLHYAVQHTEAYPPDSDIPWTPPTTRRTRVDVENTSTLAAASLLVSQGLTPVLLNFGSARRPGGGFLSGSRAQEESLARATGLYPCIAQQPMYAFHREQNDPLYSSYALYSPAVPVLWDDTGKLLEKPWPAAIISCAAPNASRIEDSRRARIKDAMRERIDRVLAIGLQHGHDAIVLGAWGCGVFRNDPVMVSALFRDALHGRFRSMYAQVIFAVLDNSKGQDRFLTFQKTLAL